MKIIIIGAGKIGTNIIRHVSHEAHEVVVIDNDADVIENIVNSYDVMGVCGNGVTLDIQKSAGVEKADLVISVTESDEANMLACLIAKRLGAKDTIARVRDYNYTKQIDLMTNALGIHKTINPESEAANEIMRIINFPEALKIDVFANGAADLVELYVRENSPLAGLPLFQVNSKLNVKMLCCAVLRDDKAFIPRGNFILEAKDKIHITSNKENSRALISKLGLSESKMKNIMIIGGGKIALYLGEELIKNNYHVKIIENNVERCKELAELLPKASVIFGDGCDQNLLLEEGLKDYDALVCLTGNDEENIILSMYANKQNVKKIITKVNRPSYANLLESIEMASVISPQEITANQIVSYIRASSNSRGNNIKTLYKIVNNQVEALEFLASANSKVLNTPLKNIKLKKDILIGGIIRTGSIIMPSGDTEIKTGDSVIVVAKSELLNDLDDILE